jgi:TrwC relaxase
VALPVKALKAGQESYWLDQIARNREEYFSGRDESPDRFVGSAAAAAGLEGTASPEHVRAMFQGLDPATGKTRCMPLLRADPRSKLAAGPLLEALKTRAAEQGAEDLEQLAGSNALKGDVRFGPGGLPARRRQADKGGDGRAALPQGPQRCSGRAVRPSLRRRLAAPREASQRAGAGLRPLL